MKHKLFIILLICSVAGFGQDISSLQKKREVRIKQNKPTDDIDIQLFAVGHLPNAIVKKKKVKGQEIISFPYYRGVKESNVSRIQERIKILHPTIYEVKVDLEKKILEFYFLNEAKEEDVKALTTNFSYNGYIYK